MTLLFLTAIGGEMLERDYQRELIPKIKGLFPKGKCDVLKNNSGYRQGIPDLTVFLPFFWAWLEVKPSRDADQEPNQEWYVSWASRACFGAFIYPENEKEVLDALVQAYQLRRYALDTPQR
jgi:hypothetical protein